MKRSAVVLLLTLAFLTLIAGVLAGYFALTDRALSRSDRTRNLIQMNLFLRDLRNNVLPFLDINETVESWFFLPGTDPADKERNKIGIYNTFVYDTPLPLSTDPDVGLATILCRPLHARLSPEYFADANETKADLRRERFSAFLRDEYGLRRPDVLLNLMDYGQGYAAREAEYRYLDREKDLDLNRPGAPRHGIPDRLWWNRLLGDYVLLTEDKTVRTVPWEDLLAFGEEKGALFYNNITPPLCRMIHDISDETDERCLGFPKTDTAADHNESGDGVMELWNPAFSFNPDLKCRVDLSVGNMETTARFFYHVPSKRLSRFTLSY